MKTAEPSPELLSIVDRVHTACLTIGCQPSGTPQGHFSLWPKYRHTWWDPGNEDSKLADADIVRRLLEAPRFTPTPAQYDDCLPALDLLASEPRITRRIITARAVQDWYDGRGGWRAIGRRLEISHTKARLTYWDAMLSALDRFRQIPTNRDSVFPKIPRRA